MDSRARQWWALQGGLSPLRQRTPLPMVGRAAVLGPLLQEHQRNVAVDQNATRQPRRLHTR